MNRNVYLCLTGAIWLQPKAFSTCIFCTYHMLGMAKGEVVFMGSSGTRLLVQKVLAASLSQAMLEAPIPSLKYVIELHRSPLALSQRCQEMYCGLRGGLKGPSPPHTNVRGWLVSLFGAITPIPLSCKFPGCYPLPTGVHPSFSTGLHWLEQKQFSPTQSPQKSGKGS